MNSRAQRIATGLLALTLAAVVWLPCLHLFFLVPADGFYTANGLSPTARALAARHLELWTDPNLREREFTRMRASNAEWDFMGRSFLVWSLANMGLREPARKPAYLEIMDRIIDETLRLEKEEGMYFFLMPYAKAGPYVAQPARSLFLDGEIALMLAARQALESNSEYAPLLAERVNLIADRLKHSPRMVLESYPNECWMFDHVIALAAIRLTDAMNGTDHSDLIESWVTMAKTNLVDPASGLLVSSFTVERETLDGPEGSTLWMVAHCLQILDAEFAQEQYERAREQLGEITCGFGYAHEWPPSWTGPADIDSGPIVPFFNISAGSSGMAFIGATAFKDEQFISALATTLNFAGFPSRRNGALRYCASNQVGDAAILYAATLGPLWEFAVRSGSKSATMTVSGESVSALENSVGRWNQFGSAAASFEKVGMTPATP